MRPLDARLTSNKKVVLPEGMDPECITLCNALNTLPGVRTHASCCGHGKSPYWIGLTVDPRQLIHLLGLTGAGGYEKSVTYWSDGHVNKGWKDRWSLHVSLPNEAWLRVRKDGLLDAICVYLEGPVGDYREAIVIAAAVQSYVAAEGPAGDYRKSIAAAVALLKERIRVRTRASRGKR